MTAVIDRPGTDPLLEPQPRRHQRPERLALPIRVACAIAGSRDARRLVGAEPDAVDGLPMWLQRNTRSYVEAVETERLALQQRIAPHLRAITVADQRRAELEARVPRLEAALVRIDALPAITAEAVQPGPGEQRTEREFVAVRLRRKRAADRVRISTNLARLRHEIALEEEHAEADAATVRLATETAVTRAERLRAHYSRRAAVYARGWTRRVGGLAAGELERAADLPVAAWVADPAADLPARFRSITD